MTDPSTAPDTRQQEPARTPLHGLHRSLGARMVPFSGYEMPVQFPAGIMAEHRHTRGKAGLFDVSHMGQVAVWPAPQPPAEALERLLPSDLRGLDQGRMRYSLFTNDAGGVLDDLMALQLGDRMILVVNAACKQADIGHLAAWLDGRCRIEPLTDHALLALQGPAAEAVLAPVAPGVEKLRFLAAVETTIYGQPATITRSGYTGEDGFEISVPADTAERIARRLLDHADVEPVGLGARDSLRLEAGLCLYGNDLDGDTTPVEAGLAWTIAPRRRDEAGFPGAEVILRHLRDGPAQRRVGLRPAGRAPVRQGAPLFRPDDAGQPTGAAIGRVTSGGFGPSVEAPVAMGYVATAAAQPGTALVAVVRDKPVAVTVSGLPFVPPGYRR